MLAPGTQVWDTEMSISPDPQNTPHYVYVQVWVYGYLKDYLKKRVFCYFLLEIWLQDFGSGLGIISDKGWLVQGLKGRDGSWKGVFTVEVCVQSLSVDC